MTPQVQRAADEEEELQTKPSSSCSASKRKKLQAKPDVQRASSGAGFEVGGDFEQQLAASRGSGSPCLPKYALSWSRVLALISAGCGYTPGVTLRSSTVK